MRRLLGALSTLVVLAACSSGGGGSASPTPTARPTPTVSAIAPPIDTVPTTPSPSTTAPDPSRSSTVRTSPRPSPTTTTHPPARPTTLPLDYTTGAATQAITVVAASHSSVTATLQTWTRGAHGWTKTGPAVDAWLGSDGIGAASETHSATPQGSFTLTEAFGHDANPGTRLPYRHTTAADWWISQPGPLYNTEQHCASNCPFAQGDPNEHLYYETPYYDYALVIDYNRAPVRQGAGSAFFLHVTVGEPTQGCVSIAKDQLVRILRWLRPADHPRILMGVG